MAGTWLDGSIDTPRLLPGAALELETHLAAVEYSLANAIVIRDRDDIQSTRHWSERLKPFEHQIQNLITFCRRAPVAMIADEVGLGKTISAGLILSELLTRQKVQRALVVCPSILMPQWQSELKLKFGIKSVYASGRDLMQHLHGTSPVIITTYHTARDRMDTIEDAGFDMAILDEAHKLKSLHGQRVPAKMATRMHEALSKNAFRYVLMLTATPIQNSPWDLYSLIDLLTTAQKHRNPLGEPADFQRTYLDTTRRSGPARLKSSSLAAFRHTISQYVVRASRTNTRLPFPRRDVQQVKAGNRRSSTKAEELLAQVIKGQNPLQQTSLAEAMMSSHAAFHDQVSNMISRAGGAGIPDTLVQEIADLAKRNPLGPKFRRLQELLKVARESDPDFRVVVFTKRLATQQALVEEIEAMGIRTGIIAGGRPQNNRKAVSDFTADTPLINVIVSTDAGAEGVNLQAANMLVNYDLPWNPMVIEQRIGRIQRLGSRYESVKIINLVVAGSIEERIVARLISKLMQVTNALGEMEPILEAASLEGEDGNAFQSKMRQLVLEALDQKDPETSLEAIEADIAKAKTIYEKEESFVRETLGSHLSDMHTAGPQLPDLQSVTPRMSVREFVAAAYKTEGASVTEEDDGSLLIRKSGEHPFRAIFDPQDKRLAVVGVFLRRAGANVQLYQPGSPAFEQLVGEWTSRHVHLTYDLREASLDSAAAKAKTWLTSLDAAVDIQRSHVGISEPVFQGELNIRASVGVAHDRLDRLVCIQVGPKSNIDESHDAKGGEPDTVKSTLEVDKVLPRSTDLVQAKVEDDADLSSFAAFYSKRLTEEVSKAGSKEHEEVARQNFTPYYSARLQSARGRIISGAEIMLDYVVDDAGPYTCTLQTTADGELQTPAIETCAESGRTLPSEAFSSCDFSQKRALTHLLISSEHSGRRVLPQYVKVCEVSGQQLAADEVTKCVASGKTVNTTLLDRCSATGSMCLPEFLKRCEITDVLVMESILAQSEVSGKAYRSDQQTRCTVSGKSGHQSEFETCQETRVTVLPEFLSQCDVSGLRVRADLLVTTDTAPQYRALARFTRKCDVSGRLIPLADGAESSVSGKWADRKLLVTSEKSGAFALPEELIRCEVSQRQLCPAETGTCADTGMRVDQDLLRQNDLRNVLMLTSRMQVCPESQKWARAEDFTKCEATGLLVDPELLIECSATHKPVLQRLTVSCAECEQPLLKNLAVTTESTLHAHENCTVRCTWTGNLCLRMETGTCQASGVIVRNSLLNNDGVLTALKHVQQQSRRGASPDVAPHMRELISSLGYKARRTWTIRSEAGQIAAVGVLETQLLGLRLKYYALLVDTDNARVIGKVVSA